MSDWDAEDFEIPAETAKPVVSDKWDGEDEEAPTKESWEDEEEEGGELGEDQPVLPIKKKKKKLTEILADREREAERKRLEKEEAARKLTPEEKTTEKIRLQKVQEDSDLALLSEIMGVKTDERPATPPASLDSFDLTTESGLSDLRESLVKKIQGTDKLDRKLYYVSFIEDLCRALCENLESDDVKRVTTVLNTIYNDKVKANKASKGKKKGAGKAKLNSGHGAIADSVGGYNDCDDFI